MKHDLILHIIRNPYGWADDEVRNARLVAAALIEQQAKQIEALRAAMPDLSPALYLLECGQTHDAKNELEFHRDRIINALTGQWP